MSRATGAVRFHDGTVKWCLYNGTSDLLIPKLFDDPHSPWDAYRAVREDDSLWDELYPEPVGEVESVTIFSSYGYGWTWPGTAARNVVVDGRDPFVVTDEDAYDPPLKYPHTRGRPDWYAEAYKPFRKET